MQKIATRIFIDASITSGIFGILMVLTSSDMGDNYRSALNIIISKLLFTTVFIILPSFALSIASKYLKSKS